MSSPSAPPGRALLWTGRVLGGLPALFLLVDAVMKFAQPKEVVDTTTALGYPAACILPLGIVLLVSTLLYLLPRTAVLGAILLTGYLGGAVATHVRVGEPFVVPLLLGVLLWAGLYLRDERVRALLPLRKAAQ